MSQLRRLTLIAPALDRERDVPVEAGRVLATVMARGSVAPLVCNSFDTVLPWQRLLGEVLAGEPLGLASAPVSWLGEGGALDAGYVLHATPVSLVPTTDRLRLTSLRTFDRADLEPLAETLASRWLDADAAFAAPAPDRWYLRPGRRIDAATVPLDVALMQDVRETLPQGPDAGWLRRVTTEAQMLLHEHPANVARERRGLPPVSSVWLWGGGAVSSQIRLTHSPRLYGDEPYLAGLARLAGSQPPESLAAGREALQRSPADLLIVTQATTLADFIRDWLEAAIDALNGRAIDRLLLVFAGYRVVVTRAMLRRFWRRTRSLATWFA